jgi:hypothetical protein
MKGKTTRRAIRQRADNAAKGMLVPQATPALLGRPEPAVLPAGARLEGILDRGLKHMFALRTCEGSEIGMGGTRFDPGQHHAALTFGATRPFDRKKRRGGTSLGFRHVSKPLHCGGSATGLSVTARCPDGGSGDGFQPIRFRPLGMYKSVHRPKGSWPDGNWRRPAQRPIRRGRGARLRQLPSVRGASPSGGGAGTLCLSASPYAEHLMKLVPVNRTFSISGFLLAASGTARPPDA